MASVAASQEMANSDLGPMAGVGMGTWAPLRAFSSIIIWRSAKISGQRRTDEDVDENEEMMKKKADDGKEIMTVVILPLLILCASP